MKIIKLSLSLLLAVATSHLFADAGEGEKLFKANCISCHAVATKIVGPALKDVDKRRKEEWLIKWISNSPAMIQAGDADAVKLFEENNKIPMLPFPNLKDDQIKSILEYIKKEGDNPSPPVVAAAAPSSTASSANQSKGFYSKFTLYILLSAIAFLLIIVVVLFRIKKSVQGLYAAKFPEKFAAEAKEKLIAYKQTWNYKLFKKHPVVGVMVVLIIFSLVSSLISFDYANRVIGVQKGYTPNQPIKYSHQLHAGKYKINCQYCHSGADKSKQATIPSASTCMNCHSFVTASANYGGKVSPEIQKIYDAVGWDADKKVYDANKPKTPIKWVRVHNLPDFAYFNHAQHVRIGKVECQACHGAIETMDVVGQQRSLQMSWCINCHREAKVNVAENNYYEQLHKDLKAQGKTSITVAENGGIECSKCHY